MKNNFFKLKFFLVALFSIILMFLDYKLKIFNYIYTNNIFNYFFIAKNKIYNKINHFFFSFSDKKNIIAKYNDILKKLILKESMLLKLNFLSKENENLRKILGSPLVLNEYITLAEVISLGNHSYNDQILIDKGRKHGVYLGQTVINNKGIIGQVVLVNSITSIVLPICNINHSLPIQVLRNDFRSFISGQGCKKKLTINYFDSINIGDINIGDILVTSGLGGKYPKGYPAGIVSSLQMDSQKLSYISIQIKYYFDLEKISYVALLWEKNNDYEENINETNDKVKNIARQRLTLLQQGNY